MKLESLFPIDGMDYGELKKSEFFLTKVQDLISFLLGRHRYVCPHDSYEPNVNVPGNT